MRLGTIYVDGPFVWISVKFVYTTCQTMMTMLTTKSVDIPLEKKNAKCQFSPPLNVITSLNHPSQPTVSLDFSSLVDSPHPHPPTSLLQSQITIALAQKRAMHSALVTM